MVFKLFVNPSLTIFAAKWLIFLELKAFRFFFLVTEIPSMISTAITEFSSMRPCCPGRTPATASGVGCWSACLVWDSTPLIHKWQSTLLATGSGACPWRFAWGGIYQCLQKQFKCLTLFIYCFTFFLKTSPDQQAEKQKQSESLHSDGAIVTVQDQLPHMLVWSLMCCSLFEDLRPVFLWPLVAPILSELSTHCFSIQYNMFLAVQTESVDSSVGDHVTHWLTEPLLSLDIKL